jgi:hypothetical protein
MSLYYLDYVAYVEGSSYDNFVTELLDAEKKGEGRYGVFDFSCSKYDRIVNEIVLFSW